MNVLPRPDDLAGLRILVVEDSFVVAEIISDLLADAGAEVVGPLGRIGPAVAAARQERLDGALLDVMLVGENAAPVAAALRERGIPFIFLTGHDDAAALPPAFRAAPRMLKPFRGRQLQHEIAVRFREANS